MTLSKIGLIAIVVLLVSCASQSHQHLYNESMYTNVGFYFDKDLQVMPNDQRRTARVATNRHLTANYLKGTYVPAGTKVKVVSVKGDVLTVEYDGKPINITNVPRLSGLDTDGMVNRYLSKNKVSGMSNGEPKVGMTKSEVIKAIGYPPAHATPSTEENTWIFWKSSINSMKVVFADGKVSQVID